MNEKQIISEKYTLYLLIRKKLDIKLILLLEIV
jgi:hypothetical protein